MYVVPRDLREVVESLFGTSVEQAHSHGWIEYDPAPNLEPGVVVTKPGQWILDIRGVTIEPLLPA